MGLFKEFKEFALKGSVIDLAIGVIIGEAFGSLTKSMVDDMLMPPIGKVAGNLDFSNLYISLSDKIDLANTAKAATQPTTGGGYVPNSLDPSKRLPLEAARALGPVVAYGKFITNFINLLIVTFCVFMLVKGINIARKRLEKEQAAAPPPPPTADVVLLTEIRDLLKQGKA